MSSSDMGRKWWHVSAESVRARVPDINDGTLAVAGALSAAGVKFSEVAAEREVQRDLIREEERLLQVNPTGELAELTESFMA